MEQFAAIDLGSNSFHLVVAREEEHALTVIDRERDMVRLAGGLDEKNLLTSEASDRALECLERFGERLRGLEPGSYRLRWMDATNGRQVTEERQVVDGTALWRRPAGIGKEAAVYVVSSSPSSRPVGRDPTSSHSTAPANCANAAKAVVPTSRRGSSSALPSIEMPMKIESCDATSARSMVSASPR